MRPSGISSTERQVGMTKFNSSLCPAWPIFVFTSAVVLRKKFSFSSQKTCNFLFYARVALSSRVKARPCFRSRRPFAQSVTELMESFTGKNPSHSGLNTNGWRSGGRTDPTSILPPSEVGNPDLGLSRSAWTKLNRLITQEGRLRETL